MSSGCLWPRGYQLFDLSESQDPLWSCYMWNYERCSFDHMYYLHFALAIQKPCACLRLLISNLNRSIQRVVTVRHLFFMNFRSRYKAPWTYLKVWLAIVKWIARWSDMNWDNLRQRYNICLVSLPASHASTIQRWLGTIIGRINAFWPFWIDFTELTNPISMG